MSRIAGYVRDGRAVKGYERDALGHGLTYVPPVRVDSRAFGKNSYGHVQSVNPDGTLRVRVEEPGDPSVMDDLRADFPGTPDEHHELIDTVHHSAVRDATDDTPLPDPRPRLERMKANRAKAQAVAANVARMAGIVPGPVSPEMAAHRAERARVDAARQRRSLGIFEGDLEEDALSELEHEKTIGSKGKRPTGTELARIVHGAGLHRGRD